MPRYRCRVDELATTLRARGMRLTEPRRRVVDAVRRLGHATPDAISAELCADGGDELALSTVYRNLDALEAIGVVSHTHLDHRSPTYHLADHADHVHLVCRGCGVVFETATATTDGLVGNLRDRYGFEADVKHLAIHGWCATCSASRST